ncbi:two-component system, OmpR family, phosphate regulon sensor histidine kinase PhoR [Verrucomicrobium sp. GAS474]|uniref:sensor histidine kinase n=1 Tax=Verrucomicrobium sp. GAS474 TaxID=1882831 RepID=UPI00087B8F89|nr:ATP-binding protein [Verrucomicrobium sp. GAS474]SDT86464.1 two-component system, OmpR family, phosphate regulon sensor histidine kinase PhoR [Verrucomicrobium sp. GAS474]
MDAASFLGYLLFTLCVGGVVWFGVHRRWIVPARRLEATLVALAEGRKPGSLRHGHSSSVPQSFLRIANALEQLTDRYRHIAEQGAQEEKNLRAILLGMVEGVLVIDAHHRIREANAAFCRQFGVRGNPAGRSVLEVIRVAEVHTLVGETLQTGEPREREIVFHSAGPEEPPRFFDISAVPVDRGEGREVVAIFHDISRLKQLEEVRREFVANVSHELRTPLSIFRGYLETLMDHPDLPRSEVDRVLATLMRHSTRLNALVDDLLTLARLESRRLALDPVSLRIGPFLQNVVDDFQEKLADKKMTAAIVLPANAGPGEVPAIEFDPSRLEQVFFNLLDNAIKYSGEGSAITLRVVVEPERECLRIEVADRGPGIPPADLPHIFERFYRVDKARSRDMGGTGLGLSIVKHIVQMHAGEVWAESKYGEGTTIVLRLPLSRGEEG